jgi:hypothetical protein
MDSLKAKFGFSLIVFPLAGMAAALVSMSVSLRVLHATWNPFGSLFFGIAIAACLWLFHGLRSISKTLVFILA